MKKIFFIIFVLTFSIAVGNLAYAADNSGEVYDSILRKNPTLVKYPSLFSENTAI